MFLGVSLLGFVLPGTLYASWTWSPISFPVLGKFSAIISSNIFSGPFSLFSFWDAIMQMLVHLILSLRSLGCLHFFFFSFFCLYSVVWPWFPPFWPPSHLFIILPHLFCCWFLLVYYSSVCSLVLIGLWYTFLASSPLFSWNPGSSSVSLFWILFLEGCLLPLHLVAFLGFYLVPSFET